MQATFQRNLYYASVFITKALEGVESIQYRPVNPRDISLEKAESFIPDRLYTFIYWILSANQACSNETISNNIHPCTDILFLSLSIYTIYESMGEVRTPKHVGMSIT